LIQKSATFSTAMPICVQLLHIMITSVRQLIDKVSAQFN